MPSKKKNSPSSSSSTSREPSPVKFSYLFLFAYLGLIGLAFGVAGLVNVGLEEYALPKSQDVWMYRSAIDNELNSRISYDAVTTQTVTLDMAKDIVKKARENLMKQKDSDEQMRYSVSNRNRALSLSVSFLIIGGIVYVWHRKDVFRLLKSKE
jgi:hypothetical protein